ncbi:MAG: MFS transporter [Sulfobacillus benefaciens]|uniref:MFS transporter n=1 Tax=Sulfobacillus benefaciens TaxID=453960 RepID=A0A2T2XJ15_9FIRM|nr:MAG: MFS transporter [Sulfobacillus benefaciens]
MTTHKRYWVFGLMFFAIFINYMDRVNFSVSIPAIRHQFNFSLEQMGTIAFVFTIVYALFNFPGGYIADRLGIRLGMVTSLGWWSLFTIMTAFSGSFMGWLWIRGLMGAGEAPIWAINSKSSRTWAAPQERSRAFTIPGSGQYLGPTIGTLLAGWIVVRFGWQWSFISFGILGIAFLPVWWAVVRNTPKEDPRVSQAEREKIGIPPVQSQKGDWEAALRVVFSRTGLGVLLTFLTFGYILFTFITWVPSYMYYTFHIGIIKSAAWSSIGFAAGFIGFLLSGPFNDALTHRFDRLKARRIGSGLPMTAMIVAVSLSLWSASAHSTVGTALFIGLAQFCMNLTVGSWAVNAIDIAPSPESSGLVYGIYNGVLNVMGAFNALILTWLATRWGFPAAFGSAIFFMLLFLVGILFVIDRPSYERLVAKGSSAFEVTASHD